MNSAAVPYIIDALRPTRAIESDFPSVQISELGEQESWRKEINRPIYHIHKWWATRLGSVFRAITLGALSGPQTDIWRQFYEKHNLAEKVVLDPFMGSGTTLGEALKLGAKAVGCDINPVSTFLVRQAFTRVPEKSLRDAFAQLEKTVAPAIRHYYQTRDPKTGNLIPVLYYFWVKTVTTPEGEVIPLLSRYVFSQDAYPKKKPRAQIVCPNCWGLTEDRYDASKLSCLQCKHQFNPQEGPVEGQYVRASSGTRYRIKDLLPADGSPPHHRLYALMALREDGKKVYLPAGSEDEALFVEAEGQLLNETLPLPTLAVRPGHNTDQARGYNYLHWHQFFNARQLLCLGMLLRGILEIEDAAVQEQMICLFSSTLEFNNLFCSFKGEGTGAVRHMFSNHILKPERTPLENSVWGTDKSSGTFSSLFESRLLRAKHYLDNPFELEFERDLFGTKRGTRKTLASAPLNVVCVDTWNDLVARDRAVMILNGDSARLPIPDASVDAIVTDPPYFDFVHYSELSDFFFAWLSPVLSHRHSWMQRPDSSDNGEVQHKDPRQFARQLFRVFTECKRVLKEDGVIAFSFHHSRAEGWAAIYEAVTEAGFEVVAAHPVHAELRGASPKNAAKNPINLDAILVCKKRIVVEPYQNGQTAIEEAKKLINRLESNGYSVSSSDHFVVLASQLVVQLSKQNLNFEFVCNEIQKVAEQILPTRSSARGRRGG